MVAIVDKKGKGVRFSPEEIRGEFPILSRTVRGRPILYLDNAATAQKPRSVIDTVTRFYESENANIHRGIYHLSDAATDRYENSREIVRRFIGARDAREIVFVRGATEAINLVASSYGGSVVSRGETILVSEMEHHANIVPWQMLAGRTGAHVRKIPITDSGELDETAFDRLLALKPRIVAITHQSNALGTINPIGEIARRAHAAGATVIVDGAQAVVHQRVDVGALDADFYVFSGHKVYGPTGVGVLYGRAEMLAEMPPYHGGGEMIRTVTFDQGTTYKEIPYRFEAGTPPIAEVIGLGAAIEFLESLDRDAVERHERELLEYATEALRSIPGLRVIGTARNKSSVLSFVVDGVHPHDLGTVLDSEGVCIRAGQHCAQPVMDRFGIPATVRASLALYSVREEIDGLVAAIEKARGIFG